MVTNNLVIAIIKLKQGSMVSECVKLIVWIKFKKKHQNESNNESKNYFYFKQ